MRDQFERFKKANTEILAISVDTVETQAKFRDSLKVPFALLADVDQAATKAYGVLLKEGNECYAARALYLVDAEGKLRWMNAAFDLKSGSFDSLYREVEALNAAKAK
ncbi:MAG: peroxiredoxin family protein [Planctomycetes bacterium]|nr:peroxiredoxin family protein [Planctomycetota bacterium]